MTLQILLAEIELELTAPAAVGAPERQDGDTARARPIARDGWGNPWIPPTSLAGSFRAHLPADLAPVLMGSPPPENSDEAPASDTPSRREAGDASPIRFLGTEIRLPHTGGTFHRTRAVIDADRGAAGPGLLHTAEYLPAGTRVLCRLRVDGAEHHAAAETHLLTWQPVLGGGRTTGHGTVRVTAVRRAVIDLDTAAGRALWLTAGGPALFAAAGMEELRVSRPPAREPLLAHRWEIVDALHVGTGEHRPEEPARIVRDHRRQPVIPGTTWKGLLRGRAAYILRSLDRPACPGLADACGSCPLCTAFGWTGTDGQAARGLLRFPDTPVDDAHIPVRQHVAIDRFTGGAAESLLYQHEVVESGTLDLAIQADADIPPAAHAALVLALWDLHSGVLGVGGGTTRGYGTLRCTDPPTLERLRDQARKTLADD